MIRLIAIPITLVGLILIAVPLDAHSQTASRLSKTAWKEFGVWIRKELPKEVAKGLISSVLSATVEPWLNKPTKSSDGPRIEKPPVLSQSPATDGGSHIPELPTARSWDEFSNQSKPQMNQSWDQLLPKTPRSENNILLMRGENASLPRNQEPVPQRCSSQLGPAQAFEIGYAYDSSRSDPRRAQECYLVSAQKGSLYGAYLLAHSYLYDEQPARVDEGLLWLTSAANRGLVYAQVELGDLYHPAGGVVPDRQAAMYWYRIASNQAIGYAEYMLADLHGQGDSELDQVLAFQWLREAIIDGYEPAVTRMSEILPQYYELAVQKGDRSFLYVFGFANEFGVPRFIWPSPWDAGAFYCYAARQGYSPARKAFAMLVQRYPSLPDCN
jgi:TPR repeat protein